MSTILKSSRLARVALAALAVMFSFFYAHTTIAKEKSKDRKIASIRQLRPTLNQTEALLQSPHSPEYLNKEPMGSNQHSRLRFYGSCRDSFGYTYTTTDSGYADCISQSNIPRTDSSVSSFYKSTQRQGGAALLLSR